MPDQPPDPLHYDMKIPPEKEDADLETEQRSRSSGKVTAASSEERKEEQGREQPGSDRIP